ncbi:MAG: hypothetical protein KatS3mg087_1843 [Patescibacteria group bacterium]|nr:MAG: hypothetical protein KatS3mg087_1843 [Patescibacteria group bacterium]
MVASMYLLATAIVPVFLLLVFTEYLWRANKLRGESARKLVHIIVGSYVAFWPFIISFEAIQAISAAFLLVVAVSLRFDIFKSIHGVARQTWGEVLFAIGIGLIAVLTDEPWVFAACILHMSVADGFAALAGIKWGKSNCYKVIGHTKSVLGTAVFWLCSIFITGTAIIMIPSLGAEHAYIIIWLPLLTAAAENIGIGGTDNVIVPVIVYLALTI